MPPRNGSSSGSRKQVRSLKLALLADRQISAWMMGTAARMRDAEAVAGHDEEQVEEDHRRRRNVRFTIKLIIWGPEVLHHVHARRGRRQRLTTFGLANLIRQTDWPFRRFYRSECYLWFLSWPLHLWLPSSLWSYCWQATFVWITAQVPLANYIFSYLQLISFVSFRKRSRSLRIWPRRGKHSIGYTFWHP